MFTFKPLWKTLIEKELKKTDLQEKINSSWSTITAMGKNQYISMEILDRICNKLDCKIEDVIEHVKDTNT